MTRRRLRCLDCGLGFTSGAVAPRCRCCHGGTLVAYDDWLRRRTLLAACEARPPEAFVRHYLETGVMDPGLWPAATAADAGEAMDARGASA